MEENFETRNINLTYMDPDNPVSYDELTAFGWEQVNTVVVGYSEYAVLVRDKKMPNYKKLAELDEQYFSLKSQIREYHGRFVFTTFFMYLIFFIVPGIIYIGYKIYRKKEARKYNEEIQAQMDIILKEANKIIEENIKEQEEKGAEDKQEETPEVNNNYVES